MVKLKACVTISETHLFKAISIAEQYEIAEIRLDLCKFSDKDIQSIFASHKNLIATYRGPESDQEKERVFRLALEAGARMIDVDHCCSDKLKSSLIRICKKMKKKFIYSYHNFEGTDDIEVLSNIIRQGQDLGAEYIKMALKPRTQEEYIRILNLYTMVDNLIAFPLGEKYNIGRIEALYLGAPFMYVYHGGKKNQVAEGQFSYKQYCELKDILGVAVS